MGTGLLKPRKRWGLVLMGGGARGLAHIGVLEVLEERGLIPDVIVGTSMGAVIGGFYAAGLPIGRIKAMACDLGLESLVSRRALRLYRKKRNPFVDYLVLEFYHQRRLGSLAVPGKDRVESFLEKAVGKAVIEDLPVRFACNALDVVSGREFVFKSGRLSKALRATMSYPIGLEPARAGARLFLDGGLLNNAPVGIARDLGAERVVLSDVHKEIRRVRAARIHSPLHLAQRVVQVVLTHATEDRARSADLVLRIRLDVDTLDFTRVRETIRRGRSAALAHVPAIRRLTSPPGRAVSPKVGPR